MIVTGMESTYSNGKKNNMLFEAVFPALRSPSDVSVLRRPEPSDGEERG